MAPPRSRPQPADDSRSEASSTKEKIGASSANTVNGKNRRVAGTTAIGSSLRDVVTAGSSGGAAAGAAGLVTLEGNPGVSVEAEMIK